jgi:hypothetical protein
MRTILAAAVFVALAVDVHAGDGKAARTQPLPEGINLSLDAMTAVRHRRPEPVRPAAPESKVTSEEQFIDPGELRVALIDYLRTGRRGSPMLVSARAR